MTRGAHFLMTHGTRFYPDYPHQDFPKRTRGALLLSGLPQGEAHDTHKHHIRTTAISHPDDRHILSGYVFVRIVDWSKQVLHVISTACHGPCSATYRVKGQEWSDGKSLPMISDSRGASHDLCQPPVGWWWPCHHLEASWQAKNLPTIKERNKTPKCYIYGPSHKEEGKLAIPSTKANWFISLTMADKTIGGCVRTPCPDAFCRNDWTRNLYWLRSCVHPFGNYVDH